MAIIARPPYVRVCLLGSRVVGCGRMADSEALPQGSQAKPRRLDLPVAARRALGHKFVCLTLSAPPDWESLPGQFINVLCESDVRALAVLAEAVGQDRPAETDPSRLARCLALRGEKGQTLANFGKRKDGAARRAENSESPCKIRRNAVESGLNISCAEVAELADAQDSKSCRA